jgi:hypothetical protein
LPSWCHVHVDVGTRAMRTIATKVATTVAMTTAAITMIAATTQTLKAAKSASHLAHSLANAAFRRAAEKVFETLVPNCPAFVALLFRVRNIRHASGSPDYGSAFILSTAGDQSGRAAYEAVPVEPHMLNDYGFYSGTFEVNGMRITTDADILGRMNCRS